MKVSQLFVSFLFCGLLTTGYARASEAEEEIIDCDGEAASTQFCIDKEEAFELRARIEAIYPALKELPSPPWDDEDYLAAESTYNEGVKLYRDAYFGDAVAKFETALESFTLIDEALQTIADEKRTAISDYFEAAAYGTAVTELNTLVEWFPEDLDLVRLHAEATQGLELKPLVESLQNHVSSGNFQEVEELLPQFPDGYYKQEISQVRASLEAHRQDTLFNSSMTAIYESIDAENWFLAEQVLESALLIRPNSTVAQQLLNDVKENKRLDQVDELTQKMSDNLSTERWEDVLDNIKEVETLDVNEEYDFSILEDDLGDLLALELELAKYESTTFGEMDDSIRQNIQELLDKTERLNEFARTKTKRQTLVDQFTQYTTPVEVKILSDNATNVRIRPGKEIGSFHSKTVKILPGTYEVIGIRRGYKQVVKQLEVSPGSDSLEIKVECSDRF